jgi:hypothetical protein
VFFWTNEVESSPTKFFIRDLEVSRNVDEICMAELVSLAKLVSGEGKTEDGAVIAMAKRLGLHHVRAAGRRRLEQAIRVAKSE